METISREAWLTYAIKVSWGIYANSILVAVMAAYAALVDIYRESVENKR